eukprot:643232_1
MAAQMAQTQQQPQMHPQQQQQQQQQMHPQHQQQQQQHTPQQPPNQSHHPIQQQPVPRSNDAQQQQQKLQMARNIAQAYQGRVSLEQVLAMSFDRVQNLHNEIVSRLNQSGQQQQAAQHHPQAQPQQAQAQAQQRDPSNPHPDQYNTSNPTASNAYASTYAAYNNGNAHHNTQHAAPNQANTTANAPNMPADTNGAGTTGGPNANIMFDNENPIDIVLVLLHQYPQIETWLQSMEYHGTVTTSRTHAVQFLTSLMDSQPQFTQLIKLIQQQLKQRRAQGGDPTQAARNLISGGGSGINTGAPTQPNNVNIAQNNAIKAQQMTNNNMAMTEPDKLSKKERKSSRKSSKKSSKKKSRKRAENDPTAAQHHPQAQPQQAQAQAQQRDPSNPHPDQYNTSNPTASNAYASTYAAYNNGNAHHNTQHAAPNQANTTANAPNMPADTNGAGTTGGPNANIMFDNENPIDIVLVLLHQYPQIETWLQSMEYHGTVTTSRTHAVQFLTSLMDSQPQFT